MKNTTNLIATLGSKPQLVTLAAGCLIRDGVDLDEVLVVHTDQQRPETSLALGAIRDEFTVHYPAIALRFLEISNPEGPLMDVTAPTEVETAFRVLFSEVWKMKKADQAIHFLIAGGRRTLAVFGMAAAQMLFDDNDHLWHLASHPALEASGALRASDPEWVRLIPIPFVPWGRLSPVFDILRESNDPFNAAETLQGFRLHEQWDAARIFVLTKLTPAESSVAALLVQDGLRQNEIAGRLGISLRTVESHLRAVYRKAEDHWEVENINRARLARLLGLYFSTRSGF